MMPKYIYKQKLYNVTLRGDSAGGNIKNLAALFALDSKCYDLTIQDNWQDKFGKPVQIAEWLKLSEWAYLLLIAELEILGAISESFEYEIDVLFEEETLLEDSAKRYSGSLNFWRKYPNPNGLSKWENGMIQAKNEWYSKGLLKVGEPALELWAKAERIEEAYRLTTLPAFSSSEIIRIYKRENAFYLVHKLASKDSEYKLEWTQWKNLQTFMDRHFWTNETWYGRPVLDGVVLLFEGWKDGKYKFLDDHSPNKDNIAAKAHDLFQQIKTACK